MENFWMALGLTVFAGMATGFGSLIAFMAKRTDFRFLSIATGFSAGVMLYVAFVEIFFKGAEVLTEAFGDYWGHWINTGGFFAGMLMIGLIDALIPAAENPHEVHSEDETRAIRKETEPEVYIREHGLENKKLMRMGLFTALAITIHNFPEGIATFLAALEDPALGVAIAIAVALHNIPEGISVSVPIYYATGSRLKAFWYSVLSGLAEPLGAIIAYFGILMFFGGRDGVVPPEVMGFLFSGVAGTMVYISLDELLPASRAYGKGHDSLIGLVAGMVVMALSLLLMM
jgi:ZIP family zinc transporter